MRKQQIRTSKSAEPAGHFSPAVMIPARGVMVFISGMTARAPDGRIAGIGDIEGQTRQVCENLKAAIEAAGGTMDDVCRVDVYLRNIGDSERVNKVRREFFSTPAPASTVVEVSKLASPEFLVMINAIAVVGTSAPSATPPPA